MSLGDFLREYMKESKVTMREIAKRAELSPQTISNLVKVKNKYGEQIRPDMETFRKLAKATGFTAAELMAIDNMDYEAETDDIIDFPIIGDIAAGYNGEATENFTGDEIQIPKAWLKGRPRGDYFTLKVKGDSMYPLYQDGDIILVKRQTTLNHSGQIGVVMFEDTSATLKKVEYVYGEDWMRLIPINPAFPPIVVRDEALEHCRVLGYPVNMIRDI